MSHTEKMSNYLETVRKLDIYYGLVKRQLLQYQSATTGLFPAVSTDEREGCVKDSIYCAAAIWSLYQAYRRIDDDQGKSYELGQSAVKSMRGILQCWVKQAEKIELFKENQCNAHSLHCKFNLVTGDVIHPDSYPHLQIIYTQDEVAFVQNLVYYVERAYRTPDYGIWERGTKYNNGTPEIHASSIGVAKSALEAINGFNLFGDQGASWSVIYVDIDAHNRNRSIFNTMLPRESSSKEVDAALICTVSYPVFATHQQPLASETLTNVVAKLRGTRGFKRFPRDGYKTVLENTQRRFYLEGETKGFENVESEWPLFFIFMMIDGLFKRDEAQVDEYRTMLEDVVFTDHHGDVIIPMYYYVRSEDIERERSNPGTRSRYPSAVGSPNGALFLWAQALYLIAELLRNGLVRVNELDPIRRYQSYDSRPRPGGRYSVFQGMATDLVVQIVLIAESMRLQAMMATYGIQTQTPHQVEPVQIWSSSQLVKVYENLGVNSKLNLKGRPARPVGALGTSKVYRICGMTVLCYPLVFEVSEFYLYRDMALLIDDIKTELHFVGHNWRLSGRPTVCLLIREDHMRDSQFKEMLELMAALKSGCCDGTKVRIGRLQNLISSSCIEHLDFMSDRDPSAVRMSFFKELEHDYIGYQSLTDVPRATTYPDSFEELTQLFDDMTTDELVMEFRNATELRARCRILDLLLGTLGETGRFDGETVRDHVQNLYYAAGNRKCWDVVRYCSSLLKHTVDSISPFITTVLVNGKQLAVGVIGHEETINKPMNPAEIHSVMYARVQPYSVIHAVLQQEVVLYCGRLIATEPDAFKGILKIRIGWLLHAITLYLKRNQIDSKPLECHSPYELRKLIHKVLSVKSWAAAEKLTVLESRQLEGCLCRVPSRFYVQVWDVLSRTPDGIRIGGQVLHQQPILSNMARSELSFALLVEETINRIGEPEYRQIIVELLFILSTTLTRNPELTFQTQLDLDHIVSEAVEMFKKDNQEMESGSRFREFFSAPYSITTSYLARAVVNNVLQGCTLVPVPESDQEVENHCKIS